MFPFYSRFSADDTRPLWTLVRGHINRVCGETPTNLRMGVPAPTNCFVGLLSVTLTQPQRKAASKSRYLVTRVNLKIGSRRSLNASPCLKLMPTRTTLLCGLRLSSHDLITTGGSIVSNTVQFRPLLTL
jgi:hypothetical protein